MGSRKSRTARALTKYFGCRNRFSGKARLDRSECPGGRCGAAPSRRWFASCMDPESCRALACSVGPLRSECGGPVAHVVAPVAVVVVGGADAGVPHFDGEVGDGYAGT